MGLGRKGGVVGQGTEVMGGAEKVATQEFGRGKGEVGMNLQIK